MEEILHIKNYLTKNGIISCHNHYEDGSLTINYTIKTKDYNFCFAENDFIQELSLIYNNIQNDIFAHKILLEKNTGKLSFILSTANWRGDFEDKIQPEEKDNFLKLFLTKINDNINTNYLAEKLKHNFNISANKILNTESVYKENIASFSKYENGGAFIDTESKTNENILNRLHEYPKVLSWIKTSSIKNYGYDNPDELITFIMCTEEYIKINNQIKEMFPEYELQIFRRQDDLVLSVIKNNVG